jgi:hypothetical protein
MGGSLNMVYRDEKGNTEFREIYTGGMYAIQMSHDIIEKKDLTPLLDEWYDRSEVFDSNTIHPSGYGLFVVDYLNSEMYSIQGYCGTGDCYCNPWSRFHIREEETKGVLRFIKENRVTEIEYFDHERGECKRKSAKPTAKKPFTEDSIKEMIKDSLATFTFDMSPFKVMRFSEDKAGYRKLKKHMTDRGFGIDKKAWSEFIKDTFDH